MNTQGGARPFYLRSGWARHASRVRLVIFTVAIGLAMQAAYPRQGAAGLERQLTNGTLPPVQDIFPGDAALASSNPSGFVTNSNLAYFVATDTNAGSELWQSDGTPGGTQRVKDINPGAASSAPTALTYVDGTLFFSANDGSHGYELWKSDGTASSTVMVKDIYPGTLTSIDNLSLATQNSSAPHELINAYGLLFFVATTGSGDELWRSDGTEATTLRVKASTGANSVLSELTAFNGMLYFIVSDSLSTQLWKSDGTESGTILLKESPSIFGLTRVGIDSSRSLAIFDDSNTQLFFAVYDGSSTQLWKTDGTSKGTSLIRTIYPFPNSEYKFMPALVDAGNSMLYFRGYDSSNGVELWQSDGTAAGTHLLKDINPGPDGSFFTPLTSVGVHGALFFTAFSASTGNELWLTDGTPNGTRLLKDINPGMANAALTPHTTIAFKDSLFFYADDGLHGNELWQSDGTPTGTRLFKDINPGPASSLSAYTSEATLASLNNSLLFGADDGGVGLELWKSDGTPAGTALLKDINPPGNATQPPFPDIQPIAYPAPDHLTPLSEKNMVFFSTFDSKQGTRLWKSDGTQSGTQPIKTILPDTTSPPLDFSLTQVNGTIFFNATDPNHGTELWKDDAVNGNALTHPVMVKDIYPGTSQPQNGTLRVNSSSPAELTNVNGQLFFIATDEITPTGVISVANFGLWKSDGTEAGTVRVKEIVSNTAATPPTDLTDVNGTLFFAAVNGQGDKTLWKSDGTEPGTLQVKAIVTETHSAAQLAFALADLKPSHLTNVDGTLFFFTSTSSGCGLWKSDGTEAGTQLIAKISPASPLNGPDRGTPLINVNKTIFFPNYDAQNGVELWKSDGTESGTVLVKDLYPGPNGSFPAHLAASNGRLLFSANDGVSGYELWQSDGTEAGTVLVKDIYPGLTGSLPQAILPLPDGRALVVAADNSFGMEVWQTNGTQQGTSLLLDIAPGPDSSNPGALTIANQRLYLVADDGHTGRELWSWPLDALQPHPVAYGMTLNIQPQLPISGTLHVDNPLAHSLQYTIIANVSKGVLQLDAATGVFTYTPNSDAFGYDHFTFRVNDGEQVSNEATITLVIQKSLYLPAISK